MSHTHARSTRRHARWCRQGLGDEARRRTEPIEQRRRSRHSRHHPQTRPRMRRRGHPQQDCGRTRPRRDTGAAPRSATDGAGPLHPEERHLQIRASSWVQGLQRRVTRKAIADTAMSAARGSSTHPVPGWRPARVWNARRKRARRRWRDTSNARTSTLAQNRHRTPPPCRAHRSGRKSAGDRQQFRRPQASEHDAVGEFKRPPPQADCYDEE